MHSWFTVILKIESSKNRFLMRILSQTILLILICNLQLVTSQNSSTHFIKDAETNEPIAFANVAFHPSQKGVVSDIQGKFIFHDDNSIKSISISCLGYEKQELSIDELSHLGTIYLTPVEFSLSEITVFPGINPALGIVDKILTHRSTNHADLNTAYSNITYHKMNFALALSDSTDKSEGKLFEQYGIDDGDSFLLIESVSEKKHLPPNKNRERIISSRVSGFNEPTLGILPTQIQSFNFYEDKITILNEEISNPISKSARNEYFFQLKDTLINAAGDTILYITFEPKQKSKITALRGSMHIHKPSYAIQTVSAATLENQLPFHLSIRQNYKSNPEGLWFPEELDTQLKLDNIKLRKQKPTIIIAQGKSMTTAINTNPNFSENDLDGYALIDESDKSQAPIIQNYRAVPLTRADSMTYLKMDSIGRKLQFDQLIHFQKNIMLGYLPMGALDLNINKLIGVNRYEGIKVGLGLRTSSTISHFFAFEGFYVHSTRSGDHNFGGEVSLNINPYKEQTLQFAAEKNLQGVGRFDFLEGYHSLSDERYKEIATKTMEHIHQYETSFTSRVGMKLKAQLKLSYLNATPVMTSPFFLDDRAPDLSYNLYETELRLKWQPNLKLSYSGFGIGEMGGNRPTIWTNYSYGLLNEKDSYHRVELQAQHEMNITHTIKGSVRSTSGHLMGNYNASQLYSAFGSYLPIGIESRYSFATMRPNEFAASRFSLLFLRAEIPTRVNASNNFKPIITLSTSAGWGETLGAQFSETQSFDKGYIESGIYIGGLLKQSILKYGVAVHYRYGPYRLPNELDNFAFRIGLSVGL